MHQRFVGSISDDGATIDGEWQSSDDGQQWTRDFLLTYARINTVRESRRMHGAAGVHNDAPQDTPEPSTCVPESAV